MIKIRNTLDQYGFIAVLLHWFMAIVIIGMLGVGLYMTDLPNGILKLKLYGWHKEFGILILMLAVVRLCWRLANFPTRLASHELPTWQKLGAYSVHYAFYFMMFAMPITGWLISSAADLPVSFFGLFVLPDLIGPSESARKLLEVTHEYLGYGLMVLIFMHVAAVVQHLVVYKENLLRRMWL